MEPGKPFLQRTLPPRLMSPSGPHLPAHAFPRQFQLPPAERWVEAKNWPPPPLPQRQPSTASEEGSCSPSSEDDNEEGMEPPLQMEMSAGGSEEECWEKLEESLQVEEEAKPAVFADAAAQCPPDIDGGGLTFEHLLLELAAEHRRALAVLQQKLDARRARERVSLPEEGQPPEEVPLQPEPKNLVRESFKSDMTDTPAQTPKEPPSSVYASAGSTHTPQSLQTRSWTFWKESRHQKLRGLALRHLHVPTETLIQKIVNNATFELVFCVVILLNFLVMALELQYLGFMGSCNFSHPDCPEGRRWPGAEIAFSAMAAFFMIFFLLEFTMRTWAMTLRGVLKDPWMWMDVLMITGGVTDMLERFWTFDMGFFSGSQSLNPTMLRAIRVLRLLRLMKVLHPGALRILKNKCHLFPSLFLLIKSLQASREALFWSVVILLFVMSCMGMLMHQVLLVFLEDPTISERDRFEVFEYYGTFTRMITTMFELTMGNWAPPSRLLMKMHSAYWGLFIVIYRCIFCFALVNVTNAVFITETNRVAANDDEVITMRNARARRASVAMLQEIFQELDESGDGCVNWVEFSALLKDDVIKDYLSSMDLAVKDLEDLFNLLDDGDGLVQAQEFIVGMQTLRGMASNMDMLTLLKMVRKLHERFDGLDKVLLAPLADLRRPP